MRRVITWLLAAIALLALAAGGAVAVAVTEPFAPGHALFAAQQALVEARLRLVSDATQRADLRLGAAEARLEDLRALAATDNVVVAYDAYDAALEQAIEALALAPDAEQGRLRARLGALALQFRRLLPRLTRLGEADPGRYAEAAVKAAVLLQLVLGAEDANTVTNETSADTTPDATWLGDGRPVPFPPNATAGPHDFFPLTGQHRLAQCSACHGEGRYQGTLTQCTDCHSGEKPAEHYGDTCENCHTTTAWQDVVFDHAGATDCLSCHLPDRPQPHFDGQCAACHATTAWLPATFDHSGVTDCLACHLPERPTPHYEGQCSQCHSTSTWAGAVFNHGTIGLADCAACHTAPAGHWPAPCARCHTDTGSFRNARFDHSAAAGQDCADCHQPPANHWPAPCARCHGDTTNFRNAGFDHSAISGQDCAACHGPPPNHFSGQCASCHTDTSDFRNASFNHTFPITHEGANGDCATCHPSGTGPQYTCANCHGAERMQDKHDDVGGFGANCVACHADGREVDD